MIYRFFLLLVCVVVLCRPGVSQNLKTLTSGQNTSIRALSVLDNQSAWAAGSNGWVAKTDDRGTTWVWVQIPGASSLDFRTLYAFDSKNAVVASAGTPLQVFRTDDGGGNWKLVYEDHRAEIFMDGTDFWDNGKGLIYGDPIQGNLQLLFTEDYGRSWVDISDQADQSFSPGEAGFAASGTGIRTHEGGKVWIGTGGSQARILYSGDYGFTWDAVETPILQGKSSQGIFSIAVSEKGEIWAVGGDYVADTISEKVGFMGDFQEKSWRVMDQGPFGYKSCVELLDSSTLLACGTTGVDVSKDGGLHWKKYTSEGFHVVRKARKGNWVLLAGPNGEIAEFKP